MKFPRGSRPQEVGLERQYRCCLQDHTELCGLFAGHRILHCVQQASRHLLPAYGGQFLVAVFFSSSLAAERGRINTLGRKGQQSNWTAVGKCGGGGGNERIKGKID